jgi:hypothetical protein
MKNPNLERCALVLKLNPLEPNTIIIFANSRTLVILLQVDPAFGDEPETVCEAYYETEDTSIFAWFLVPSVGHYRWLRSPIRRLLLNSKVDYLVCTI